MLWQQTMMSQAATEGFSALCQALSACNVAAQGTGQEILIVHIGTQLT